MNTDLTAKIPFREHIKNIKKILKIIIDIDKWYFLFTSIVHIINVIEPYIQLVLSAYILDAIIAQKNFKEVMSVITSTIFIILCLDFIASSIWNRMEVHREKAFLVYSCMTQTKMLDMDFSRIDSPEIRELRKMIITDNNWGAGINSLFWQGNAIIFGLFNIIGAAVVAFPVINFLFDSGRNYVIIIFIVLAVILIISMKTGIYFKKKTFQFMFMKINDDEKEESLTLSWDFASGNGFNYKNGNVSFGIKVEKRQDIDNDDLSKYFSYKLKNGQIIEQSVTIDGYKGRWLSVKSIPEIDEAEKNDDSIMDIIFFTKDEYVYSFYFSAENKMMYDETEPLIDSMLSTINFMEK